LEGFTATGALLAARRIRILRMNQRAWRPTTSGNEVAAIHRSSAVLKMLFLYMQTLLATAEDDDLSCETAVNEYLQFPYENIPLVTVVNSVFQATTEEKSRGLQSGERALQTPVSARHLCFYFLFIKSPVLLSSVAEFLTVCRELFHHEIYIDTS
jgi:vesicle coat complex subunit